MADSRKFHGAVVGHDGSEQTRVFEEAAELGRILGELSPLAATGYTARAALVYNWENRWALEGNQGPMNGPRVAYLETVKKHYFALWNAVSPLISSQVKKICPGIL